MPSNINLVVQIYHAIGSLFKIAIKGSKLAGIDIQWLITKLTVFFAISGSALQAQDQRMKVIAENIANASTSPAGPGQKPITPIITFKNEFDKAIGAYKVKVGGVKSDSASSLKNMIRPILLLMRRAMF